jgi:hypothetical protein
MRKITIVFFLLLLVVLQSCDSEMHSLGDGFEYGYVTVPEASNVYYENIGLIDRDEGVEKIWWNDEVIVVYTRHRKWIMIHRRKVMENEANSVTFVTYKSLKNIDFEDDMKIE